MWSHGGGGGGGTLTLERGMGMCRGHDPLFLNFFQASRHSLAYQFTINAPLMCPPFSIFRKILDFQPCFGQNFRSQDANFCSQDPSLFKENPLPRPYFWKPLWHIPTKKGEKNWVPFRGITAYRGSDKNKIINENL